MIVLKNMMVCFGVLIFKGQRSSLGSAKLLKAVLM